MCLCAKRGLPLHRIASAMHFSQLNAKRNKKINKKKQRMLPPTLALEKVLKS